MKIAFAALAFALSAAAPVSAQEDPQVRAFLAIQMGDAVREAAIEVEDSNESRRITAIETGDCRATIRAGARSWEINWRTADGVEPVEPFFFFVHAQPPLAFVVDEDDPRAVAALARLQRAMDRAWNLCE